MIGLSIIGMLLVLSLGYAAQWYKNRMDMLVIYVQFQESWIDRIIEALEGENDQYVEALLTEKGTHASPLV